MEGALESRRVETLCETTEERGLGFVTTGGEDSEGEVEVKGEVTAMEGGETEDGVGWIPSGAFGTTGTRGMGLEGRAGAFGAF